MSHQNRVFITGRSIVSAVGSSSDDTWNAILKGEDGIAPIVANDLSSWPYNLGGELKDFQPAKMLPDRKLFKVISRQDVLGINAAVQAVENSKMIAYRDSQSKTDIFNERTAVFVGSPGNKYFQQYDFLSLLAKSNGDMQVFAQHLFDEVHPTWLLRILPNNVLAYTGITYGFKGANHNVTNHAVGGSQALIEAYHSIQSGQADRAVVVAYDVATEPQSLLYYGQLGVLSAQHLKPFDKAHDGTIMAEGAAAIILESEESVKNRGAHCYAEMIGGMANSERQGLFSIQENGETLAKLLRDSFNSNKIQPEDISLITAHGNGNALSDDSEAKAFKAVFSDQQIPITGFKWSLGHTVTASGLIDTVLACYALENKLVPGIANLQECSNAAAGLNISREHKNLQNPQCALIINRGFASMNSCVVLKHCE